MSIFSYPYVFPLSLLAFKATCGSLSLPRNFTTVKGNYQNIGIFCGGLCLYLCYVQFIFIPNNI